MPFPTAPTRHPLGALALLAATALALSLPGRAPTQAQGPAGQRLFGHDNGRSATIEIDTATGRARAVGGTGFDSGASGMATAFATVPGPAGRRFAAGTFFGILGDNADGRDYVVVVDPVTGRGEKVVRTSERLNGRGIAFGPDGSTLYALSSTELVRVDTRDGQVTRVGDVQDALGRDYSGSNLEWDPDTSQFVSLLTAGLGGRTFLALIDPATALVSLVAPLDLNVCTIIRAPNPVAGPGGVDWPAGTWFTIDLDTSALVRIEFDAAQHTASIGNRIGNLGAGAGGSVCGTAFTLPVAPPTPTAAPTATPVPSASSCVCAVTRRKAPLVVIADALANPEEYAGWNQLLDPNKPGSPPWPTPGHDAPPNPRRTCLDVLNRSVPFHPVFNGVIWRASCYGWK